MSYFKSIKQDIKTSLVNFTVTNLAKDATVVYE